MKNRIRYGLLLCCLVVSMLFIFSGCGSSDDTETAEIKSIDITLSIEYPVKSKIIDIKGVPFRLEEETSVLQMIELYGNVNNISVLVDTTHGTLEGISGIINGIYQNNHTWKFKINGKNSSTAVSDCILEDGDSIEFIYVKK